MFSRRSRLLAPGMFAVVSLLLLALSPPFGSGRRHTELFIAGSADDRALTRRIAVLSPTVSLDEARRVTYCAVTTGLELAHQWRVVGGAAWVPGLQNLFIKMGARKGGYCFHYSAKLLVRLEALKLQTLEFHWGESLAKTMGENNAIVVTARGQPFEQGILLDNWRYAGHLAWTQVTMDPEYHWTENKSEAARTLGTAKNVVSKQGAEQHERNQESSNERPVNCRNE